jgi:hypothetical protein
MSLSLLSGRGVRPGALQTPQWICRRPHLDLSPHR